MIHEIQHYRPSFAHLLVWITALTLPLYLLIQYLSFGDQFSWRYSLETYQLLAAINMLGVAAVSLGTRVSLLPRGITGITPTLRAHYIPYSGILDAQPIHLLGLRMIRMKNEAEEVVFVPLFLGNQREFLVLLDGLLPEKHVVRECFETPRAYVD